MGSSAGVSTHIDKHWKQLDKELDKLSPLERVKYIDNLLRDCTPRQPKPTSEDANPRATLQQLQTEKQDLLNTFVVYYYVLPILFEVSFVNCELNTAYCFYY